MSKDSIDLAAYFEIVADLEANLEDHKIMLVRENDDYNTIDAFRIMDEAGKGVVTKNILFQFMMDNFSSFQVTNPEVELFIRRFDQSKLTHQARNILQVFCAQCCKKLGPRRADPPGPS